MVTRAAAIPVAFTRVYDSRIDDNHDFGPGWRLSLAEEIVVREGTLTYTDRSGARHRFALDPSGSYRASPPKPSHLRTKVTVSSGRVRLETENGAIREFTGRSGTPDMRKYSISSYKAPNGGELVFHYDDEHLSSVTVRNKRVFSIERDARGRIVSASDNLGRTVRYSYTADYLLKDVLDVAGHLWWYEYDEDRLARAMGPNRQPFLKVRYRHGKVSQSIAGRSYAFEYHPSRRTQVVEGTGAAHTFHQAESGATYQMQSSTGASWRLVLGPDSLPRRLTTGRGSHFFYYDSARRLVKISESSNEGTREWTMEYDEGVITAMRSGEGLTTVMRVDDRTIVTMPLMKIEFATDSHGVRYVEDNFRIEGISHAVAVERDSFGEISAMRSGTSTVYFVRNGTGRITGVTYPNGFESAYAYDALGNRVSAHYSEKVSEHYAYDPSGNIVRISSAGPNGHAGTQAYLIGKMNRVRSIVNVHNGLSMDVGYDVDGNPVTFDTKDDTVVAKYQAGHLVSLRSTRTADVVHVDEQMRYAMDVDLTHERTSAKRSLLARNVESRYQPDYGTISFSESNQAMVDDPIESGVPSYVEASMILDLSRTFFAPGNHIVSFEKPSNPVFHPPEYASLNCCVPCVGLSCICAGASSLFAPANQSAPLAPCGCLLQDAVEFVQRLLNDGGSATEDSGETDEEDKEPTCLPCRPPVGTLMFLFHTKHNRGHPDSGDRNHNLPGSHHYHHLKVGQIPATHATRPCECQTQENTKATTERYPEEIIDQPVSGGGLDDC